MKGNIFIKRKAMACAISIVICLVGYIALTTLPVEQYPNIAPPTVNITASYSGADPATVTKSVVQPIEESVNGVQDMQYIKSSVSSNGEASIQVFFKQGTDPDMAAVNVQNRVSKAQNLLPPEVTKSGVTVEKQQNSMLQICALSSTDNKYDADFIANYLDINVKPRLQRISGIGGIQIVGNTYALRIWMQPDAMARYGLTPDDIFSAIGRQSLVAATGSLGESSKNTYQYNMEYSGRLTSVEEFNSIVLRSTKNGQVLHLADVAKVELGALSYNFASQIGGHPGVFMIINQASGANATAVNAEINKLFEDLTPTLPAGMEFTTLMSSDDFLYAAIHNVVETLIIAIILVVLIVFFFLQDFKATLIPSISICVSLLGTFAIIKMAGFSMNILTLFALVLAIGTVVDDAIVVVEAVMAKMEAGCKSAVQATKEAMSEVTVAVISCTLVFMAVFIPVTFISGTSGAFFTQFGITIASSVGLSCISALTLCPALCALMLKPKKEGEAKRKNVTYYTKFIYDKCYNSIFDHYCHSVKKFLSKPILAWILLIGACVLMFWMMKTLPSGLVPQEDQGVILVEVRCAPGSTLAETDEILNKVEKKVKAIPELQEFARASGYGLISGVGSCYGTFIIRLKPWDDREGFNHYLDMVLGRFYYSCEDIKEAQVLPFSLPQIPGYGNSNSISMYVEDKTDGDMSEFNNKVENFMSKLLERPEISDVSSTYSERFPKYHVKVDAAQCERAGISPQTVLSTLGNYCGSAYVGDYNQFGKVYRIMANAAPEYRTDNQSLSNIFVQMPDGEMSPINQFVSLEPVVGSDALTRFNLFQSISLSITSADGYSEGDAHKAIAEVFEQTMPLSECGFEYAGMSRELEENAGSNTTAIIYCICIFLIYLILVCLYESWLVPLAVLLSVPFGLMGSFLFSEGGHLIGLPGMDNNIYLQTGVIMLIGLLAKTAILITEFAVDKRKEGHSIFDAAFLACQDRLRPILMTVASMVIGMIPLIIEGGAGANGNRSLAIGVVGGMCIGTVALLFVVPVFYIAFQTLDEKLKKSKNENDDDEENAATAVAIDPTLTDQNPTQQDEN